MPSQIIYIIFIFAAHHLQIPLEMFFQIPFLVYAHAASSEMAMVGMAAHSRGMPDHRRDSYCSHSCSHSTLVGKMKEHTQSLQE